MSNLNRIFLSVALCYVVGRAQGSTNAVTQLREPRRVAMESRRVPTSTTAEMAGDHLTSANTPSNLDNASGVSPDGAHKSRPGQEGGTPEVEQIMSRLTVEMTTSNIEINAIDASNICRDILLFIAHELGAQPSMSNGVKLKIGRMPIGRHASVRLLSTGERLIEIDAFNFYDTQRMYLAHEMFHAFFQTDSWLKESEYEIESWAMYIQLRYAYPQHTNKEIYKILIDNGVRPDDENVARSRSIEWRSRAPDTVASLYMASALNLFRLDEASVSEEYRKKISSPARKTSRRSKPPVASPMPGDIFKNISDFFNR